MTKKHRWGIIGCGKIAQKFATSLKTIDNAVLYAVASRDGEKAKSFAKTNGAKLWFDNYEMLASHPDVHIIYIATPHSLHYEHTMLAVDYKKHVLCEKPLAINAIQTRKMIQAARNKRVFMMEAMWMRFNPAIRKLVEILNAKIIGEITQIQADFCVELPYDKLGRVFNPELGGGAMLDVGVYPLNFAYLVFGEDPIQAESSAKMGETGVDYQSAYMLKYKSGAIAMLSSSVEFNKPNEAWIYGTKGHIHLPLFYKPQVIHIHMNGGSTETLQIPFVSTGYSYEAEAVMESIEQGRNECALMPLHQTLNVIELMDRFRNSWGFKYPGE
jgi:dihydrodiol dehydrogenase / D-xylose 1-dehydrogenase (NADP)